MANRAFYNHLLRAFGRPDLNEEQLTFVHSHAVVDSVAFLFDDETGQEAVHAYRKTMTYMPYIHQMKIEPHLKPLIERIRPPYKTAVASNRSDTMGHVITEHGLGDYFDLVVCAEDVPRPKPHPDLLIKVLRYFNLAPHQMFYVGDSQLDEAAAGAAGVPFIAYDNPSLAADFHIDSLKEIEAFLPL